MSNETDRLAVRVDFLYAKQLAATAAAVAALGDFFWQGHEGYHRSAARREWSRAGALYAQAMNMYLESTHDPRACAETGS